MFSFERSPIRFYEQTDNFHFLLYLLELKTMDCVISLTMPSFSRDIRPPDRISIVQEQERFMDHKSKCKIKKCWITLPYFFFDFLGTGLGSSETSSSSDGTKINNIWLESAFLTVYFIDNCVIMSHVIDLFFQRSKSPGNPYDKTNSDIIWILLV